MLAFQKMHSMEIGTIKNIAGLSVNGCKFNLTRDFAKQRLAIYRDKNDSEIKKFVRL